MSLRVKMRVRGEGWGMVGGEWRVKGEWCQA